MGKIDLEKILMQEQVPSTEEAVKDFPRRHVIRDASYALAPQPPIEWIIDQLISEGSVNLFYGDPGSKKTYSILSLGVCVALGKSWLGFDVSAKNVLIIDEESGERRLSLRLGAAIRGELGDEDTPIVFVSLAGVKLDDKANSTELLDLIQEIGAGLVIIDALADVMDGDENSKMDTQPVFTTLRRMAEKTNAAIIVIHHSNKSGGYRGSSAIKGALDLMIKIDSIDGSNLIKFKTEKSRDSGAVRFAAVATWTDDQFYLSPADEVEKEKPMNKSQKYVIRYLNKHGASPLPDMMGAADSCSPNSARQAVYSLVELGEVYRTNPNEKGRGAVAVYDLAKDEEDDE